MAMDTYEVEIDGTGGFVVKVAKRGGPAYLTSPSLPSLSHTRRWIDEHGRSAAILGEEEHAGQGSSGLP